MLNLILSSSEATKMTLYEVFSVISLIITSTIAFASIITPCIINRQNIKANNKQKQIDLCFNLYQKTIDEFTDAYGKWRSNSSYKKEIFSSIYKVSYLCKKSSKCSTILEELAEIISSYQTDYKKADKTFYKILYLLKDELYLK